MDNTSWFIKRVQDHTGKACGKSSPKGKIISRSVYSGRWEGGIDLDHVKVSGWKGAL